MTIQYRIFNVNKMPLQQNILIQTEAIYIYIYTFIHLYIHKMCIYHIYIYLSETVLVPEDSQKIPLEEGNKRTSNL